MSGTEQEGRKRVSPGTVLGVIAVVLAASGVAHGGIPAADGTITACMGRANRLHLIDKEAGEVCADSQTEITLNQPAEGGVGATEIADEAVVASKLGPVVYRFDSVEVGPGETAERVTRSCEPGEVLLTGGTAWSGFSPDLRIVESGPDPFDTNRWEATGFNGSTELRSFLVEVLCLES